MYPCLVAKSYRTMALTSSFVTHMESSRHLLFYRLGSYPLPMGFHLPHVTSLTLIQCTPTAISQLLHPSYFPSLQQIQYLSGHPGDTLIHRRFPLALSPRVVWKFPTLSHPFYDAMVEAGWGRRDDWLVMNHIVRHKQMEGGKMWFDLYLPGKGILCGKWYYAQQMAYLRRGHCVALGVPYPVVKEPLPTVSAFAGISDHYLLSRPQQFEREVMQTILEGETTQKKRGK